MKMTPQITLKNVPHSEAVEAKIREKIGKLDQFSDRIMGCRVTVEESQRKQHQGKVFSVRIDITMPGKELVVNRIENEDLYVAIRDAFDAGKRQIEEHARKRRGDVKTHAESPRGTVAKLFPFDGYGFIMTSDGREIYFHRNSVIDPTFDRLEEGAEVAFLEEQGQEGPQAVRVSASR
jgi:ribosomal subunit interface protein